MKRIQRMSIEYFDSENTYKNLEWIESMGKHDSYGDPVDFLCNFLIANGFADEINVNRNYTVSKTVMNRLKGEKV